MRDAILIGLILSVAILYGFLRNWGTTLVATLVIPVTVLVTFVAMWIVGLSFDLMTLGGVAAAIGLVIDDAIVVVENIYTHMVRGESRARGGTQRDQRDLGSDHRLDDHAGRRLPSARAADRRDRRLLPIAGADDERGAADVAVSRADVYAGAGGAIRSREETRSRGRGVARLGTRGTGHRG